MLCDGIPLIVSWILVLKDEPKFHHLPQYSIKTPCLHCHNTARVVTHYCVIIIALFASLCVSVNILGVHCHKPLNDWYMYNETSVCCCDKHAI